jgi:hypothetical protein
MVQILLDGEIETALVGDELHHPRLKIMSSPARRPQHCRRGAIETGLLASLKDELTPNKAVPLRAMGSGPARARTRH